MRWFTWRAAPDRSGRATSRTLQLSEWSHVIDLNLTSAFLAARAVVPLMRKQRRGRIVPFSSVIADGEKGPLTTVTGRLPYATAKAALLGSRRNSPRTSSSSASR